MIRFRGTAFAVLAFVAALDPAASSTALAARRGSVPPDGAVPAPNPAAAPAPRLEERGRVRLAPAPKREETRIRLANGIEFDTRVGEPAIPGALRAEAPAPGERASWIVQVEAPVGADFAGRLEAAGASVVAYLPEYAFLVRADDRALDAVTALPFVRWTGAFHPAYRISSQPAMALRSGTAPYQVLLFPDGDLAAVAEEIARLGGRVEDSASRVNRIVRLTLDAARMTELASHPDVQWIEPREVFTVNNDQVQWVDQTFLSNNRKIWDQGIDGTGQVVMVGDSGIRTTHNMFRDPSVPIGTFGDYPTHRKIIAYVRAHEASTAILFGDTSAASYHGTHTSGTFAGNDAGLGTSTRDGIAKGAKIYFLDGGANDNLIISPGDLNEYFQPAYDGNAGGAARVSSNSWGGDTGGAYTLTCMTTDQFAHAHPDFLISFSNGNAGGANTVGSPAAAKNILSSGGTQNGALAVNIYSATSRGPTDDGRRKPTVCSPGQSVVSASGASDTGTATLSGTSMSSPNLAGSATLVRQYFTDGWYPTGAPVPANAVAPSAALLRAMMINSAVDDFGAFTIPDNNIGWGRILLDNVLFFPGDARRTVVLDEADGVATGEAREYSIEVTDVSQPLEITLVWTDPPSTPTAGTNLVNDLDLVVEQGATTYLGNVWSGGQSATGGSADAVNVEENFLRTSPAAGTYVIRVEGANVPFGPQPFALVVTGGVGGSTGVLFVDAGTYGPSESIGVRVEDADGGPSVAVTFTSASEPGGETLVIAGASGVYEGSLPLTLAAASGGDGLLSVAHGDAVTIAYADASPAHVATATAIVDTDDPEITAVAAQPADVSAVVNWTTNTLADSQIEFGTTPALGSLSTRDFALATAHAHVVEGLSPETTYYFDVLSRDHEGNLVRDDFGGMHYRFTTGRRADVLLVNADPNTTLNTHRYADALTSTGWTFNEWRKAQADVPLVGDSNSGMRSYKAVWWQAGWEQYPAFERAPRDSITAYHDGGGRIAFVSHDIAWTFSDATSGFYNAARQQWFENTMHSDWQQDPATWATVRGVAGDPISNTWIGGIPYTPFRSGGAGDEVDKIDGAGTGAYVWRDSDATVDDIAVRWESAAPLGTPGVGVWGGSPTRTVAMFFEWLQLNAAVEGDATRAAVLDETLQWLIGGDHPDAVVVAPNGGETITTPTTQISWTVATDTGAGRNLGTVRLEYSDDGGMSWNLITTSPGASPYTWNVSALPTGTTYRVRAVVTDTGAPVLSGADASNGDFTVAIPGNEIRGPVVLAGTPGTAPSPVTKPDPAVLVATISDALTGGSNVTAAEWSAGPSAAAAGTGTAMSGAFGAVSVAVTANLPTASLPGGATTLWVRGRDAAGNWGPATALPVQVNGGTTDAPGVAVPPAFALGQNFPNPFERSTSIAFALPQGGEVDLRVYDVQGRLVRTLVQGARAAGRHTVAWDGADDGGRAVASGVYFYRLNAAGRQADRKLLMLR